jgi:hypothetical protein
MIEPDPEGIAARLNVEERVLLFCIASGTNWSRAGISSATARTMIVKDLVGHDRKGMRLMLTRRGRAVLQVLLARAGIRLAAPH